MTYVFALLNDFTQYRREDIDFNRDSYQKYIVACHRCILSAVVKNLLYKSTYGLYTIMSMHRQNKYIQAFANWTYSMCTFGHPGTVRIFVALRDTFLTKWEVPSTM